MTDDLVHHPSHYNQGRIEVIEFIEDKNLNFNRGNAVKYISRAGIKNPSKEIEDLQKAVWYLNREIELIRSAQTNQPPKRPNDMTKTKDFTSVTNASDGAPIEPQADTAKNAPPSETI